MSLISNFCVYTSSYLLDLLSFFFNFVYEESEISTPPELMGCWLTDDAFAKLFGPLCGPVCPILRSSIVEHYLIWISSAIYLIESPNASH
ncbi:hypothetical protein ACS0TY_014823 [Phlomoides rotata]